MINTAYEVIEREFKLDKQWNVYASTRRIFLKKRSTVRDIDYNHISSIQFTSNPNWVVVLAGMLSDTVGYFLQQDSPLGWALIFAGRPPLNIPCVAMPKRLGGDLYD